MDKTYTEACDLPAFDWLQGLEDKLHARPSVITYDELVDKASRWATCACGNQCAIIPRQFGEPLDASLRMLGREFYYTVRAERWQDAIELLKQIEKRSATLIQQELTKLNQPQP